MKEFKIPIKLINMCKACVQKTRSAVRIEGALSSFFLKIKQAWNRVSLYHQYYLICITKSDTSIKMVPSGIKIGKEQLNVLAYADDIALIGKN
jgi:hypothetical protein